MRIGAATAVIIGHSWPLSGLDGVPRFAGISVHHLGVFVFFAVSGFLLTRSWTRDPRPRAFLIRRCMRIFPALVVVVLLTVLLIGPLVTALGAAAYWADPGTWAYLWNLTLLAQYDLPGVFTTMPNAAVNGSLWSLGVEFCCYLGLVLVSATGARVSLGARALVLLGAGMAILGIPLTGALRTTVIAVTFFLLGSLIADIIQVERHPVWPALVASVLIAPLPGNWGLVAAWIVVPYAVAVVGTRRSRVAAVVRSAGDPSYGMYLWAFPLQQLLIWTFGPPPLLVSIAVVVPAATLFGYASWHGVERHAIKLGAKASRQGQSRDVERIATPSAPGRRDPRL